MKVNFFGPDPAYHEARRRFVFKGAPPQVYPRVETISQAKVAPIDMRPIEVPNPAVADLSGSLRFESFSRLLHKEAEGANGNVFLSPLMKMFRKRIEGLPFMRDK